MAKDNKPTGQKVSLRYAWYALGVLFMINLVNYVDRLSIGPALEYIKRDFKISDVEIGMIAGAFMLVYAIISLPMGWLSDRGSRTKIIAIGAFLWSIATSMSGFCKGFWPFFFARGAVGSGEGIYAPSGNALIVDYFPLRLRNRAIAIFMSAMILGGAIAYIGAGIILSKTDRFKTELVTGVLLDKGQTSLEGRQASETTKTTDRKVAIAFTATDGKTVTAAFGKPDAKKPADLHTAMFNVVYTGDTGPEAEAFKKFLSARILEREGAGLEISAAHIKELPHNLETIEKEGAKTADGTEYPLAQVAGKAEKKAAEGFTERIIEKIQNAVVALETALGLRTEKKNNGGAALPPELLARLRYRVRTPGGADMTKVDELKTSLNMKPAERGEITELVFYGVMTRKNKMALERVSDSEHYSKSIGILHAATEHHYRRSDNWRWIFWILGPPGVIFALLAWFLKEPLKGGEEEFLTEEEARRVEASGKVNYLTLAKTPSVVVMVLSNILVTYCVGGLNIWLFPFVERYKGIPSAEAAISFGPFVIGGAVLGVIFSGVAADFLQKKTPRGNNIIIVAGILLSIPFIYLFLYATNNVLVVSSITLCIFFLTWINGPQNALLMSLVEPRLRAMLNGIHILLIHILGDALSPIIIGHYSDEKNLRYALAMLPVFLIVGAIGFAVAAKFVPNDLKALEKRMKLMAGSGGEDTSRPIAGH